MAIHGAEREAQRRSDYLRTEVMSQGERLRQAEAELNSAMRRLEHLEQVLTKQYGTVHSSPNDL